MLQVVQQCANCGAGLTLDDMRQQNCPYCNIVYPHHSQAAQHAQMASHVMNNMMQQQAQVQNQWRQGMGVQYPHAHNVHQHVAQTQRRVMWILVASLVVPVVIVAVVLLVTLI